MRRRLRRRRLGADPRAAAPGNINLGAAALATCAAGDTNHDGELSVAEIVTAVIQGLNGCGASAPCTAASCRPCGAGDTRCQPGAGGFYCCTLSGSLFAQLDGTDGCESSGVYPSGCWSPPDGPCHSEAICLVANSPTPTVSIATPTNSLTPTVSGTPDATATATPTGVPTGTASATATATNTPVGPPSTSTSTATGTLAPPTDTATNTPAAATATATPTTTGSPAATCPATDRALLVANNAGQTVWIGSTGASVAPTCDCPDCATTSCIVDPSLVQGTGCKCAASDAAFSGTIVCPGSATPDSGYQYCACAGSVSCGDAAACNGTPLTCYWTVPAPVANTGSGSAWELADGDSALFCLPPPPMVQQASNPVWWNGTIFARTGCDASGAYCAAGDCTDTADSGCPPGTGGSNGHSIFEVTMQTAIPDTYDVSIINGANIAIAAAPGGAAQSAPPGFAAGYWCGNPGSASPTTSVMPCGWAIDTSNIPTPTPGTPTPGQTPTPPDYRTTLRQTSCPAGNGSTGNQCYVACTADADCAGNAYGNTHCVGNACQCLSDGDCTGGYLCGTQRAPFVVPGLQQLCGVFAGWWTADVICATAAGLSLTSYGALDCSTAMQDLLGCTGTNAASGYNVAGQGDSNCCGCATDAGNPLSSSWPPLPAGSQCYGNNPTWEGQVQPLLVFLKEGCPTAYTYPFDDPTSTFNCSTAGANMMGYQVTFLPLPTPGP